MIETGATGPLAGLRVVEFENTGPMMFAAMMLADMGADVVRLERPGRPAPATAYVARGRRSVLADLKSPADRDMALGLIDRAEVVLEGLRPGVMERLGLGPDVLLARHPSLVYGRATGWGQNGPLARAAGHDVNFMAVTGMLDALRSGGGKPRIPLNLVGYFGGGALMLLSGVLAALHHSRATGQGQIVDTATSDSINLFASYFRMLTENGRWSGTPGENIFDGATHFYNTYRCADGRFVSVAALEPEHYAVLCTRLRLEPDIGSMTDRSAWPRLSSQFEAIFAQKSCDEWCRLLEGTDACFAPVLSMDEAPQHVQARARDSFVERDGRMETNPAPRFSATPSALRPKSTDYTPMEEIMADWQSA